jgi:hypothetical protein
MSANYDNTSPLYHVRRWRNVPEAEEAALEDFLSWLEYDDESPVLRDSEHDHIADDPKMKEIKTLVYAYLGRSPKVEQGEKQLLENWIKASKGA